ncbi:SusC/RagA family TonB-linked outer membrane protein [Flavivirga rizhaonensis]|uniref:TonB-dependent receptor n=1 Tax=Flavivirga rizhaonensis TaxID=2559571 RepID=A0A4S1DS88_9FLAO|nr:TonB-dependent receptor [Flavivirga rizhaonensis]TGV00811.1 TonB-dependent receptor [Flavivirga rizhaonensis]
MKLNSFIKCKPKTYYIAFLFAMSFGCIQAQKTTVKGNVVGEGQPLPGVSILVKGTPNGTVTDFDGNYEIKTDSDSVLIFSYLGFLTEEVSVNGQTSINVVLQPDVSTLDEVIVVGYGTQKRKEVSGSVGQVKAEVLTKTTTYDIGTALQGQIAGVSVTSSSGEPGAEANILIRGFSSVIGENSPLYVVDGIPFNSDPQLSISEIETIDVLKDVASAAIYGVRGAGGVILITTKQGKIGQMRISVNSEYGVQDITSGVPLMDSHQHTFMEMFRGTSLSKKPLGEVVGDIHRNRSWFTNNTDLESIILNDLASIQNHSINVSGGKENLTYNFNANYFDQEGIMINSGYKRFNVRSNTKFTKGKWHIATGITFKRDERVLPNWGVFNQILRYKPFQQSIVLGQTELFNVTEDDLDEPSGLGPIIRFGGIARGLNTKENRNGTSTTGNIAIDFDLTNDLKLTARAGATFADTKGIRIIPRLDVYNTAGDLVPPSPFDISRNRTSHSTFYKLTGEFIARYKKQLGDHNITLMGVFSREKVNSEYFEAQKDDQANAAISVLDGYNSNDLVSSNNRDFTRTLEGMLARLQYNYMGKYLFSASIRRDGSSSFGKDNRYQAFKQFSAGWNVSDESFWEPLKNVASSFKLRLSYGETGNDRIPPYSDQAVVNIGQNYVLGSNSTTLNSTSELPGLGTTQLRYANSDVKWESSIGQNFGYDIGFFNEKLTFSSDFYINDKKNLLFGVVNPPSTGVSGNNRTSILNIGDMRNIGVEYTLNYKYKGKKGFNWNASLTYTQNDNTVTRTPPGNSMVALDNSFISDRPRKRELVSFITEGYEAAAFFLRETDGVINTPEELAEYKALVSGTWSLGDLKYVDQLTVDTDNDGVPDAGDGVIDENDKVYKGSGTEEFNMGFNFNANYKGFDFTMNWYGSYGAEVMNGSKAYAYQSGTHRDIYYSWTNINPESQIPFYDGTPNGPSFRGGSDYFLEDGSFIRLRNVALGYSLSKNLCDKLGFNKFRIYVQAQNPLTITSYSGFDPEVGNNGFSARGLDRGTYPISSQYKVGLQLQF